MLVKNMTNQEKMRREKEGEQDEGRAKKNVFNLSFSSSFFFLLLLTDLISCVPEINEKTGEGEKTRKKEGMKNRKKEKGIERERER